VLIAAALVLLALNLLRPTTPFAAGLAQCVFQLSIAAPLFWAYRVIETRGHLGRVLWVLFITTFLSAGLGVLQVYYPDRFMPPRFSAQLAPSYLSTLSYAGSDGRLITRPPGLTDLPGGAAVAGGLAALLGLGFSTNRRKPWQVAALVAMSAVGLVTVYLTQVRSVLMMTLGAAAVLAFFKFRRREVQRAIWVIVVGTTVVVASFYWASSVGGSAVEDRFLSIRDRGALNLFRENRGHFLAYTMGELLDQFPLGAGVGRWGMMSAYFADSSDMRAAPLYVEIQLTGWLLDGGIPMWLFYGGGILISLVAAARLTTTQDSELAELTIVAFAVLVFIAGMAMTGPTFNTQVGTLYWTIVAALSGAATHQQIQRQRSAVDQPLLRNGGQRRP
jgi:hypothetical protein